MLPEEILNLLEAAGNPDTAPEALAAIKAKLEDLTNALNIEAANSAEKDARITTLTETNNRLLMRVIGAGPDASTENEEAKEIEDMTPEERDEYMKKLINKEDE